MADDEVRRTQLAENMRFYGDMRFKQLTLFTAMLTVIGAGIAQYPGVTLAGSLNVRTALAIAGMLFTAVMWIMEIRSSLHFVAIRAQARDLFPLHASDSLWWLYKTLSATNAVLALHVVVYFFWFWLAQTWYPSCVLSVMGWFAGVVLLLFSVISYWPLWAFRERNT